MHSALKLEKSAISKVQKSIICIFKNGKKSIFAQEKSLKLPKNTIFGLFSGAKIDFWPFLKMQIMFFSLLKLHFFPILEHCVVGRGRAYRGFRAEGGVGKIVGSEYFDVEVMVDLTGSEWYLGDAPIYPAFIFTG